MGYFLGIDMGTSYFKVGVFDENGYLRGLGRQLVKKVMKDKTCELLVPTFWSTLQDCVAQALQAARISMKEISSISYSSQANSFILLDGSDNPLTPLILWPDKRAEEVAPFIEEFYYKKDFGVKTGLGIKPNEEFAIAKINWVQQHQPKIWNRVKSILSISDYLTFNLTGQKVADLSTASMTGMFDVVACRWWDESLKQFSLSQEFLPVLQRTGNFVGRLTKPGARLIGLSLGTAYYLGGLDHHCAAIGSGVTRGDKVCESTGTVLSCVGYSHEYTPNINRCSAPSIAAGDYFQMAFDSNGALSLEWYQKNFTPEHSISELLEMAKEVQKDSSGLVAKVCVNKYLELDGFENIQPFHKHGHFVRAILESTAHSLEGLLRQVTGPGFSGGIVSTGGGARSDFWVQVKANKLKTVFYIPECSETACLGAAMIAAAGARETVHWDAMADSWIKFRKVIKPGSNN